MTGPRDADLARTARRLAAVWDLGGLWREVRRFEQVFLPGLCSGIFLYPGDLGRPGAVRMQHPRIGKEEAEAARIPFERDHAVAYLKANPGCGPFRIQEVAREEGGITRFAGTLLGACGCRYRLVLPLWDEKRFIGAICLHRSCDEGDHTQADVDLLRRVQPAFSLATLRILRVGELLLRVHGLREAVRRMPEPLAAFDPRRGLFRATGAWRARARAHGGRGVRYLDEAPVEWTADAAAFVRPPGQPAGLRAFGLPAVVTRPCAQDGICHVRLQSGRSGTAQGARGKRPAAVRLTPAERTVAILAARGLTNRQIAVRRSVSAHTVHRQLSAACAKLDAPNRYALVRLL